jgi:phosphoenolpyruvate synthase/pyruvate phosphate dikinase
VTDLIRAFDELTTTEHSSAGGKGGTLARIFQAGYPVPDGFVVLPAAFDDDKLTVEGWRQVQDHLAHLRQMRNGRTSFAVRSSALSEDSAQASFAGEFETVLDVHTNEMILDAIHMVRRSRHSERVQAYSKAKGIEAVHDMAIVVQRLVHADISGVLFTADPVTGSHMRPQAAQAGRPPGGGTGLSPGHRVGGRRGPGLDPPVAAGYHAPGLRYNNRRLERQPDR